jgi:2-haloacid dehalogenase
MALDLSRFDAMTFDCYGTLIDWEAGILAALGGLLRAHGVGIPDEELLESFGRHEARIEAGPFRRYREVLAEVARSIGSEHGIVASQAELVAFGGSVTDWPAFDDSATALRQLAQHYRIGVLTNCDDDLFAASRQRLGASFDVVVTAQQVGSYKPARRNFEVLLERLAVPRDRIVHVAQSLFHDHVPARALGLHTVWVDRRAGRAGAGATPDLVVPDVATLADLAVRARADA